MALFGDSFYQVKNSSIVDSLRCTRVKKNNRNNGMPMLFSTHYYKQIWLQLCSSYHFGKCNLSHFKTWVKEPKLCFGCGYISEDFYAFPIDVIQNKNSVDKVSVRCVAFIYNNMVLVVLHYCGNREEFHSYSFECFRQI